MNQLRQETVALLGGTGKEGQGLAIRFAAAGFPVLIGSRDPSKGAETASSLLSRLPGARLSGGANTAVIATADLVFLCVPFDRAAALLDECRELWKPGCVVIDTTVPLQFDSSGPFLIDLPAPSGSQTLVSHLPPGIKLVSAFKTISAHTLGEVDEPLDCDLIVCGDDSPARARVIAAASTFSGLRVLDGGPLRNARALEAMCVLAIGLNRRYKAKSARFRIVGV